MKKTFKTGLARNGRDLEGRVRDRVKVQLSQERYLHTLGVVGEAEQLAFRFASDPGKARLAAWLHDYARDLKDATLLDRAQTLGIRVLPCEEHNPTLLHGPVAAELAKREFAIKDAEVLNAVRLHTTGGPSMSVMDKILYLADYIEPWRQFPEVDHLRCLAYTDLDLAMIKAMELVITRVLQKKAYLHPRTVEAWNNILPVASKKGG